MRVITKEFVFVKEKWIISSFDEKKPKNLITVRIIIKTVSNEETIRNSIRQNVELEKWSRGIGYLCFLKELAFWIHLVQIFSISFELD